MLKGGILGAHFFYKFKFLVNFPKYLLCCLYLGLKQFAARYFSLFFYGEVFASFYRRVMDDMQAVEPCCC
jgi:hypothetical protein